MMLMMITIIMMMIIVVWWKAGTLNTALSDPGTAGSGPDNALIAIIAHPLCMLLSVAN